MSTRFAHLYRRRGAVVVLTLVTLTVLLGFAALTVDVGVMYNARAELQNAADAGAMAAALALMNTEYGHDPVELAHATALEYVERNSVLGRKVTLAPMQDIVFGRAKLDPNTNTYNFAPTTVLPDAVKVTVRCTTDSPSGPIDLFFAPLFGMSSTDVSASAIAAMAPRDIAIAADLSGSIRYDSLLKYYDNRRINFYDVWDALPGGALEIDSTWEAHELPADLSQAAGPGWGFFKRCAFGTDPAEEDYDPTTDSGLTELNTYQTWNDADLTSYLFDRGYSGNEVTAILDPDIGKYYGNRVAVALGLAYWSSGIPGGLWESRGVDGADAGDGNGVIGGSELEWAETIFQNTVVESAEIWRDYINKMTYYGPFRYRFGIKTFVEYLLENRIRPHETPEFASAPLQPLQAVKDAVTFMANLIDTLDSADQMSLEVYDGIGVHEVDLTTDYLAVSNRLGEMHPDHYSSGTNIGAGLERAIEELTSPRPGPPPERSSSCSLTVTPIGMRRACRPRAAPGTTRSGRPNGPPPSGCRSSRSRSDRMPIKI